jgi:hypothetical protein
VLLEYYDAIGNIPVTDFTAERKNLAGLKSCLRSGVWLLRDLEIVVFQAESGTNSDKSATMQGS